uniref:Putative 8.9 kDa family member n=1 Tax=Rhipicephalus pulchellus TaxID=72859 RepID=L7M957_RHIPC
MAGLSLMILLLATYGVHVKCEEDCSLQVSFEDSQCDYFGTIIDHGKAQTLPEPFCANVTCDAEKKSVTVIGCVEGNKYEEPQENDLAEFPYPQCCLWYVSKMK